MKNADSPTHLALLPSSGMGHLIPFLRLAAALHARHGHTITFITTTSTITSAESSHLSKFFSAYPQIRRSEFPLLPFSCPSGEDPFFAQFEAIRRSVHLLPSLLTSVSCLIADISLASSVVGVTKQLPCLSTYILFTSSAAMLALCASFPSGSDRYEASSDHDDRFNTRVPGVSWIQGNDIPPALLGEANLFKTQFTENGRALVEVDGILVNTLKAFESGTLAAFAEGAVLGNFPPVFAVGPLEPCRFECSSGGGSEEQTTFSWLSAQPERSVVYVSFGSRTAISRDQIKQLAEGLEMSRCRFLWVVKGKKVDKEEEEGLSELVGDEFLQAVGGRGLVLNHWVEQSAVLRHSAVGGFLCHCGWNSLTEAVMNGVPVLAWPQGGDQRINAGVVERSGLGIWERRWCWAGAGVVPALEISEKLQELMAAGDGGVRAAAARVQEQARHAVAAGGDSLLALMVATEKMKCSK